MITVIFNMLKRIVINQRYIIRFNNSLFNIFDRYNSLNRLLPIKLSVKWTAKIYLNRVKRVIWHINIFYFKKEKNWINGGYFCILIIFKLVIYKDIKWNSSIFWLQKY